MAVQNKTMRLIELPNVDLMVRVNNGVGKVFYRLSDLDKLEEDFTEADLAALLREHGYKYPVELINEHTAAEQALLLAEASRNREKGD